MPVTTPSLMGSEFRNDRIGVENKCNNLFMHAFIALCVQQTFTSIKVASNFDMFDSQKKRSWTHRSWQQCAQIPVVHTSPHDHHSPPFLLSCLHHCHPRRSSFWCHFCYPTAPLHAIQIDVPINVVSHCCFLHAPQTHVLCPQTIPA